MIYEKVNACRTATEESFAHVRPVSRAWGSHGHIYLTYLII